MSINIERLFNVINLLQGFDEHENPESDIMFIAGRAKGDEQELLHFAGRWASNRPLKRKLVFPGHDGSYSKGKRVRTGYIGHLAWRTILESRGATAHQMMHCIVRPEHEKITHTREESDGFVLKAQEQRWKTAIVLAHPHQLLRLMGCLLQSMKELEYSLDLIPRTLRTNWNASVYGSLGIKQRARWLHIEEEFSKIDEYLRKGRMASLEEMQIHLLELHGKLHS